MSDEMFNWTCNMCEARWTGDKNSICPNCRKPTLMGGTAVDPEPNKAGQALDLDKLAEFTKSCTDGGCYEAVALFVPELIARIRELEARPVAPDAVKLVEDYGREVLKYNSGKFKFGDLQDARQTLLTAPKVGSPRDEKGHQPKPYRDRTACADCGLILPAKAECKGKAKIVLHEGGEVPPKPRECWVGFEPGRNEPGSVDSEPPDPNSALEWALFREVLNGGIQKTSPKPREWWIWESKSNPGHFNQSPFSYEGQPPENPDYPGWKLTRLSEIINGEAPEPPDDDNFDLPKRKTIGIFRGQYYPVGEPNGFDAGHRLTEMELDAAEEIYAGEIVKSGTYRHRAALEAVIRGYLRSQSE